MSNIDLGTSSAKRATWRENDTRPLLHQIVQSHPRATDRELFSLFWQEVEDDKVHLRAIAQYYFDLAMRALRLREPIPPPVKRPEKDAAQRQRTEEVKTKLKQRVEHEARIALLQLLMPNGKSLGQCTADDCRKFGGWYLALARKVPGRKTVADALTEEQVFEIWRSKGDK